MHSLWHKPSHFYRPSWLKGYADSFAMLVDALRVEFTAEKENKFATRILRDADEKSRALEKKRIKMSDALAAATEDFDIAPGHS